MAGSVTLTKTPNGNFYISVVGVPSYEKPFTSGHFTVAAISGLIKIVPPVGDVDIMVTGHLPTDWTINGVTGFTTVLQVTESLTLLGLGIATGVSTASKQDDALGKKVLIVTGTAKTSMPANYYAYYCTSWFDGSKIASCEKTVGVTVSADVDEGIVGVGIPLGMGGPLVNKVTSVTQTAATDVICYYLKLL
jgi:3-hydroxymyristoyl/3-hydroxydecanoyl-(acyl carrier protein) dehydratase